MGGGSWQGIWLLRATFVLEGSLGEWIGDDDVGGRCLPS